MGFSRWWEPKVIQDADLRQFRRVAHSKWVVLDKVLPGLGRTADKSLLWIAFATVLGVSGNRRLRRAAIRGVVSLGVTSAVANTSKLLTSRARPNGADVPAIRRLRRYPTSSSFPSGHSASAFAFATGLTLEKPELGLLAFPLAAGVTASRVATGAHYPSDVLAGAALGTGLAFVVKRRWPVAPAEPARTRPTGGRAADWATDGKGATVVFNPSSGPGETPLPELVSEILPGAEVKELSEGDPTETLRSAARESQLLGVSGGDGTVAAAAGVAIDEKKPLLVVPSGTLNHFARDLGMESVEQALASVAERNTGVVDTGSVNGRTFVNIASLGTYTDLVDARESLESTLGKWPAVLVALAKVWRRAEPLELEIDGRRLEVWMVFAGNCVYSPPGFAPTWREHLDDGLLDMRVAEAGHPFARLRLIAAVLLGRLDACRPYKSWTTAGPVTIRSLNGPIRYACDGETFEAEGEFTISKRPLSLEVVLPSGTQS